MEELKQELARRLSPSYPDMDSFFGSQAVSVERLTTPFFTGAAIAKVVNRGGRTERTSYVGVSGKDFAIFLSGDPKAFERLALSAQVNLSSDELRLAFVRTMLETTANLNFRFRLMASSIEIIDRPGAPAEQISRNADVRKRYAQIVTRPSIVAAGSVWRIVHFALIGQDLLRLDVDLSPDGKVHIEKTVLEKDLALSFTLG